MVSSFGRICGQAKEESRGWVTAAVNDSQGTEIHLKDTHPCVPLFLCPCDVPYDDNSITDSGRLHLIIMILWRTHHMEDKTSFNNNPSLE